MTEHGFRDGWPAIQLQVLGADILVLITPSSLGERASAAARGIERLYSYSGEPNAGGRCDYSGHVGGCRITGNEDSIEHVAMGTLYALQHLGLAVRPQADAGWIGEVGPGTSYGVELDDGTRARSDNAFTPKDTTFMTWTCSTSPAPSAAPAVSRPTATSGSARHLVAPSAVTTGLTVARSQPGQGIRDTAVPVGAWEGAQSGT